jgi:hypothetical protein
MALGSADIEGNSEMGAESARAATSSQKPPARQSRGGALASQHLRLSWIGGQGVSP